MKNDEDKKSIVFYRDWWESLSELDDVEKLAAYEAVFKYAFNGEEPEDKLIRLATKLMFAVIDRDRETETRRVECIRKARSDAGKKGMHKRWKKHNKSYQNITNITNDSFVINDTEKTDASPLVNPCNNAEFGGIITNDSFVINEGSNELLKEKQEEKKEKLPPTPPIKEKKEEKKEKFTENQRFSTNKPRACACAREAEAETEGNASTEGKNVEAPPKAPPNIDVRREIFRLSLQPYEQKYGKDMLENFFMYWSEYNRSKTKMRYELQQTWQLSGRLATWAKRDYRTNQPRAVYGTSETSGGYTSTADRKEQERREREQRIAARIARLAEEDGGGL